MIVVLKKYFRPKILIDDKDPEEYEFVTLYSVVKITMECLNYDSVKHIHDYPDPDDKYLLIVASSHTIKTTFIFRNCDTDLMSCNLDED